MRGAALVAVRAVGAGAGLQHRHVRVPLHQAVELQQRRVQVLRGAGDKARAGGEKRSEGCDLERERSGDGQEVRWVGGVRERSRA